jgi:hypothetical protein
MVPMTLRRPFLSLARPPISRSIALCAAFTHSIHIERLLVRRAFFLNSCSKKQCSLDSEALRRLLSLCHLLLAMEIDQVTSCLSAAITIHALMTSARAPRPPPLRSCADEPPRVGPRHGDPAPSQVAEVPTAGFDSQSLPCRCPSSVSDFRRAAARSAVTPARCANTFATSHPSYPMAASWR